MNILTRAAQLILVTVAAALTLGLMACDGDGGQDKDTAGPGSGETPTVTADSTPTPTPTPEPRVQRIAYIGPDKDVYIINADGSGQQKLLDIEHRTDDFFTDPQWSPDGSKLAITQSNWGPDLPPGEVTYIVSAEGEAILEMPDVEFSAWSPNGDVFAGRHRTAGGWALIVLDLAGNTILELADVQASFGLSFSADSRRLALYKFEGEDGLCGKLRGMLVDIDTAAVQPIDAGEEPVDCGRGILEFSPTDPSLLAYGDRLVDLSTGQQRVLTSEAVSWSAKGQRLIVGSCTEYPVLSIQVHDIESASPVLGFVMSDIPRGTELFCGEVLRALTDLSADDVYVAAYDSQDGSLHIREIATGADNAVTMPTNTPARVVKFSPSSQHLLVQTDNAIWVVGSDGSGLASLTEGARAAWQP